MLFPFGQGRGGVKACQDGLGHFFSIFARLTQGGGLKLFGQCPYRTNIFQKGASLNFLDSMASNYILDLQLTFFKHFDFSARK